MLKSIKKHWFYRLGPKKYPKTYGLIDSVKKVSKNHWFYVCLFTGKNREVRKIWSSQKLTVNRLMRLRYGPIIMPENLKPGGWKKFSKNEVSKLHNLLKVQ